MRPTVKTTHNTMRTKSNNLAILLLALAINVNSYADSGINKSKMNGNLQVQQMQPEDYVYTGKRFDPDSRTFAYAFRRYTPETTRWTTPDPTGFPDGANQMRYSPPPTCALDPLGLWFIKVSGPNGSSERYSTSSDGVIGTYAALGLTAQGAEPTSVTIKGLGRGFYNTTFSSLQANNFDSPLALTITVDAAGNLSANRDSDDPDGSDGKLSVGFALQVDKISDQKWKIRMGTAAQTDASGITGLGITYDGMGANIGWQNSTRRDSIFSAEWTIKVAE